MILLALTFDLDFDCGLRSTYSECPCVTPLRSSESSTVVMIQVSSYPMKVDGDLTNKVVDVRGSGAGQRVRGPGQLS